MLYRDKIILMFLYIVCNFQIVRYMKKDAKCGVGRKIDAYILYTWKVCALESVVCQRSLVHVDLVIVLKNLTRLIGHTVYLTMIFS